MEDRFIAKMKAVSEDPTQRELDRYTHQNRFRCRVWITIPLGRHEKMDPGVFTANVNDEVLLNFGNSYTTRSTTSTRTGSRRYWDIK